MKFLMQIFQGEALEAWSRLSEEEQQGIAADYAALNEIPGVTPGEWLAQPDAATTVQRAGRRDRHHGRAVRGDQGGARRLLHVRGRRPRCRHRRRCQGAGDPLRRRGRDPAARPVLVGARRARGRLRKADQASLRARSYDRGHERYGRRLRPVSRGSRGLARRSRGVGRGAGLPRAPLAVPLRPARLGGGRRAARHAAPARAARAGGPPARHDDRRGAAGSDRCGLRLPRGLHPRLHAARTGNRRPAGAAGRRRSASRRRATCISIPRGAARPRREKGERHGPPHPHGRAPHLARRRDARRGPNSCRTTSSMHPSRSPSTESTAIPRSARCSPGSWASSRCGTRRPTTSPTTSPRARSEHRRAPRGARRRRAGLPLPGAHDHRGGAARRDLRRRRLRSARGLHLRRHDRPRAHVRRPPAHPRLRRTRRRRRHRSRQRRSHALGRRSHSGPRRAASARARPGSRTRCARSSCDPSSPS